MTEPDAHILRTLRSWVTEQALADATVDELLEGVANRLWSAGVPLWRAHFAHAMLHPLFMGGGVTWTRESGLVNTRHPHGDEVDPAWLLSPYQQLVELDLRHLQRRLIDQPGANEFPVLTELEEQGATDYVAFRVPVRGWGRPGGGPDGIFGSWATRSPRGWSDADVEVLQGIVGPLSVAAKVVLNRDITRHLLGAYLGADAGDRVLNGTIQRGDCASIRAVIWFSDLRGSTPLAESLAPAEFFRVLNAYFESTAGAVEAHGGEVLRFIGDATLAIFPTGADGGGAPDACARALAAARAAQENVRALNAEREQEGLPTMHCGVGLHEGEVLYGNIGTSSRIEFSVIGAAANTAARVEGLTKELDEPVLVTDAVRRHVDVDLRPCGEQALKGVKDKVAVFAPAP